MRLSPRAIVKQRFVSVDIMMVSRFLPSSRTQHWHPWRDQARERAPARGDPRTGARHHVAIETFAQGCGGQISGGD
jgi:hypothetical protein